MVSWAASVIRQLQEVFVKIDGCMIRYVKSSSIIYHFVDGELQSAYHSVPNNALVHVTLKFNSAFGFCI